jgi:sec-independent protein translocase protein TatA
MGAFQPIHWLLVAVVVLLLFGGRGKLSGLMGDAAKGVRAFRDGLKGEEVEAEEVAAKPVTKARAKDKA